MQQVPIKFKGQTLVVRELSPFEMFELTNRKVRDLSDQVNAHAIPGVHLADLAAMVDRSAAFFCQAKPSELQELIRVAKQVNPGIFRMRQEMARTSLAPSLNTGKTT